MNTQKDESGIILVIVLFAAAIIAFGYVVVNSISKSREADELKQSAGQAIDSVNNVSEKATSLIE